MSVNNRLYQEIISNFEVLEKNISASIPASFGLISVFDKDIGTLQKEDERTSLSARLQKIAIESLKISFFEAKKEIKTGDFSLITALSKKINFIKENKLRNNFSEQLEQLANELLSNKQLEFAEQLTQCGDSTVHFDILRKNTTSFTKKLLILQKHAKQNPDGSFCLTVVGVPTTEKQKTGKLQLIFKQESIVDTEGKTLLTQIKNKSYKELLKTTSDFHWTFNFFDLQKPKLEYPNALLNPIEGVDNALLAIQKRSLEADYNKPAIKGRFSLDGSLAELKSITAHSKALNGSSLMTLWDSFCALMSPTTAYLEDDAKIEYPNGSYNLRLFRYFTTEDKGSWYTDSYQYKLFTSSNENNTIVDVKEDSIKEKISQFKNITPEQLLLVARSVQDAQGKNRIKHYLEKLEVYFASNPDSKQLPLQHILTELGKQVRNNVANPTVLEALLTGTLEIYAASSDNRFINEKTDALFVLENNCLRKQYK